MSNQDRTPPEEKDGTPKSSAATAPGSGPESGQFDVAPSLTQVGILTLPVTPAVGQTVTILADATTRIPAHVTWDAGGAPTVTERLLITLIWSGQDWVGTYGLPIRRFTPQSEAIAAAILALAPAGYWKLDETSGTQAADSSGNDRSGTYAGTCTLAGRDGFPTFSGLGHVHIPHDDAWTAMGSADGMSLFALVYADTGLAGRHFIAAKGTTDAYEWGLEIPESSPTALEASFWSSSGIDQMVENGPLGNTGVWHAVGFAAPAPVKGARFSLYRDSGAPLATTSASFARADMAAGRAPLCLGARADSIGGWTGAIGHVAVFRRRLTDAEMGTLMAASRREGYIA